MVIHETLLLLHSIGFFTEYTSGINDKEYNADVPYLSERTSLKFSLHICMYI